LRRQLACTSLPFEPPLERRYPYLDRGLLEFMFAVPREELVRPTQRRSLMRRALAGIVPDEILNRKVKAFVARSPMVAISNDWIHLAAMTQNMLSSSLGIVDAGRISEALQKVRRGEEVPIIILKRTLNLEAWLEDLRALGVVDMETLKPKLRWRCSIQGQRLQG
jgi:asparagine synthase (glutamine-hydrolysing)